MWDITVEPPPWIFSIEWLDHKHLLKSYPLNMSYYNTFRRYHLADSASLSWTFHSFPFYIEIPKFHSMESILVITGYTHWRKTIECFYVQKEWSYQFQLHITNRIISCLLTTTHLIHWNQISINIFQLTNTFNTINSSTIFIRSFLSSSSKHHWNILAGSVCHAISSKFYACDDI